MSSVDSDEIVGIGFDQQKRKKVKLGGLFKRSMCCKWQSFKIKAYLGKLQGRSFSDKFFLIFFSNEPNFVHSLQ